MKTFLWGLLAVVVGLVIGNVVNGALIMVSGTIIPPPAGADVTTVEGLKAAMPLFEPKHFIIPFLAHALGTLVGAFVAGLIAPGRSIVPAAVVGAFFLLAGIANVILLPAPLWFSITDLVLAYVPMAWLGQTLATRVRTSRQHTA